jgi:hypothetical protein
MIHETLDLVLAFATIQGHGSTIGTNLNLNHAAMPFGLGRLQQTLIAMPPSQPIQNSWPEISEMP